MTTVASPDMSVVLVTSGDFDLIRRTLRHLGRQTVADRLEVILVAAEPANLEGCDDAFTSPFLDVKRVFTGPIDDVDRASVSGIRQARAPIVALVEDHAYPESSWAEALIRAHARGNWAAVGSTVVNANPDSPLSWANQLMAYGEWTEPVRGGETANVSRHNISFKKAVLDRYGDGLTDFMGRAGGFLQELRKRGYTFYLEPAARIHHANPSRLLSTIQLRFHAGRLSGASKARRGEWGAARRAAYVVGAPVIPMLRLRRIAPKLFARGNGARAPRLFPAVALALVLDGAGQLLGFSLGAGRSERVLLGFEFDRMRHMSAHDRRLLAD